jgi:hypothetical protein
MAMFALEELLEALLGPCGRRHLSWYKGPKLGSGKPNGLK